MQPKRNEDVKAWTDEDKAEFCRRFEQRQKERAFHPLDARPLNVTFIPTDLPPKP